MFVTCIQPATLAMSLEDTKATKSEEQILEYLSNQGPFYSNREAHYIHICIGLGREYHREIVHRGRL